MSFISAAKCVLLLTDDSLCIYKVSSRSANLVHNFGWRTPDFEVNVADVLNREAGTGSIYILNDTVEQHYRKEKVGKLNIVDKKNIIARRLNMAFPSYPTRAFVEIKDKSKKKKSGDQETLYLFSAVPSTDALRKLLDAIKRSDCTVSSYCLLPMESVELVEKLSSKLAKENRQTERSVWSILIGQHHGGGLRQVVIKGDQIALTRITPVSQPVEGNGAQWASDVVQEIQSTISYLARFGYTQNDGLDIMMVAKPDYGALVEGMLNIRCQFHLLTLQRAAELAGLNVGRDLDPHYAEALHVAWFAKKLRPSMPMKSREIENISKPRKAAFLAALILTAAMGYFLFNLSIEYQAINAAKQNVAEVQRMQVLADQIYQEEIKRKESLGIDIKLIQSSISIYKNFDQMTFDPLPALEIIGAQLKDLRIDEILIDQSEAPNTTGAVNADGSAANNKAVRIILKFTFPGTTKPQDGNKQLENFNNRLTQKLSGYSVTVLKQLADLTYTGTVVSETGISAERRKASDVYTGEIEIKKEIVNAGNTGAK